jgi:predicted amidohydrolase YtcJ
MCIVCGPGGSRLLHAIADRYGGTGRPRPRFLAEDVLPEVTPPLDPNDLEDLHGPADVILRGGAIFPMRGHDEAVAAMALRAGRIQRLGAEDDVLPLRGRLTRVIDLDGRAVLPGFVNAHWHPPLSILCDWLEWETTPAIGAIAAALASTAPEWLLVRCALQDEASKDDMLSAFDRVPASRPAALIDRDGAVMRATAAALAEPGVAEALAPVAGAPPHVSALLPILGERSAVSRAPLEARLGRALDDLARGGFTTVRFCGLGGLTGADDIGLMRSIASSRRLPRLRAALDIRLLADVANLANWPAGFGDDDFRADTVAAWFVDGESDLAAFEEGLRALRRRGWRLALHAEGPQGLRKAATVLRAIDGPRAPLSRADGLEVHLRDRPSGADLAGLTASLGLSDSEDPEVQVGPILQSADASGIAATLAIDRMVGVAGASEVLARLAPSDLRHGLRRLTATAASRCGADAILGSLEVGRHADLAFLDGDPLATEGGRARMPGCVGVWVGGREIRPPATSTTAS